MAEYRYTAATLDGKIVKGKAAAGTPNQLKENLLKQKLYIFEYSEIQKTAGKKLKTNQLADFCRELSSMLATGVSLVRSMQIIINRELPAQMKATFTSLNNLIKRGIALSEAMEQQGGVFPELLINMVKAGEANGRLDESLEKMSRHYEAEHRTNQDIKGAMTYPVILIVITVIVIIAVFTFIFPSFMSIFGDMELPLITQIMMGISDFLTQQWLLATVIVVAAGIGLFQLFRIEKVKFSLDKFKVKCPKVGRLMRIIYTARFARTFSSLYSGGLTILNALRISSDTIGNRYIAAQFDGVVRSVRQGTALSDALGQIDGFDIKLVETIAVGEETGRVDELLNSIADSFDYESSAAIKKLVKLIEPIMILIMSLVILTVMLSVMLPIYDMYGDIESTAL